MCTLQYIMCPHALTNIIINDGYDGGGLRIIAGAILVYIMYNIFVCKCVPVCTCILCAHMHSPTSLSMMVTMETTVIPGSS